MSSSEDHGPFCNPTFEQQGDLPIFLHFTWLWNLLTHAAREECVCFEDRSNITQTHHVANAQGHFKDNNIRSVWVFEEEKTYDLSCP